MSTTAAITLPAELAPALGDRALGLLRDVRLVGERPEIDPALRREPKLHRCAVCHCSGVLGGHHTVDGLLVWIHRSCHRRLHRRVRPGGRRRAYRAA